MKLLKRLIAFLNHNRSEALIQKLFVEQRRQFEELKAERQINRSLRRSVDQQFETILALVRMGFIVDMQIIKSSPNLGRNRIKIVTQITNREIASGLDLKEPMARHIAEHINRKLRNREYEQEPVMDAADYAAEIAKAQRHARIYRNDHGW